jgi:hypothetical protein
MQRKFLAKAIAVTTTVAFLLLSAPALFAANPATPDSGPAQFTRVIQDLPLMPGLEPVEDEDVLFDAPGSGRIAETNAMGPVDTNDVYKFYKKSLPHLGWREFKEHTYRRAKEELHIDARANQKITLVTFTVKPTSR